MTTKQIAQVAVQCTDPATGKIGTFLFIGENFRVPDTRVSPLFDGLHELYPWAESHGWETHPQGFSRFNNI